MTCPKALTSQRSRAHALSSQSFRRHLPLSRQYVVIVIVVAAEAALSLADVLEVKEIIETARGVVRHRRHPVIVPLRLAKAKGGGNRPALQLQSKIDKRKAKSTCHDCHQIGHWAGDPECPKQRGANAVEHLDAVDEEVFDYDDAREAMMVSVDTSAVKELRSSRLASALVLATSPPASWTGASGVAKREGPRGVLDTACRYTVAGQR